jgi:hypothetical protein
VANPEQWFPAGARRARTRIAGHALHNGLDRPPAARWVHPLDFDDKILKSELANGGREALSRQ